MNQELFNPNTNEANVAAVEPVKKDVLQEAKKELAEKANSEIVEQCKVMLEAGINNDADMVEFGKKIPELQTEEKAVDKLRVSFMKPVKEELKELKKKADEAKQTLTNSKQESKTAEDEFKEFVATLKEVRLKLADAYNVYNEEKQREAAEAEQRRQEELAKKQAEHQAKRKLFDEEQETTDDLPESVAGEDVVIPGAFENVTEKGNVEIADHYPLGIGVAPSKPSEDQTLEMPVDGVLQTEHGTVYQKTELKVEITDPDKVPDQYKKVTIEYKFNMLKAAYRGGLKHVDGVKFTEEKVTTSRTA